MHQKIVLMLALTGLYHTHISLPRTGDKNTMMGNYFDLHRQKNSYFNEM